MGVLLPHVFNFDARQIPELLGEIQDIAGMFRMDMNLDQFIIGDDQQGIAERAHLRPETPSSKVPTSCPVDMINSVQ